MTICYLEPEDEITGAVARIRAVADGDAVLVLPPGSRIGTSRINFKLLAREATERSLTLVAVSGEPGVRALAISAGVPAYNSVAAAESALEQFRAQDAQLAEKTGRRSQVLETQVPETTDVAAVPPVGTPGSGTLRSTRAPRGEAPTPAPDDAAPKADRGPAAGRARILDRPTPTANRPATTMPPAMASPRARTGPGLDDTAVIVSTETADQPGRRRRVRLAPLLAVALLVVLVGGVAYAGYLFLPTATISLRPHTLAIGPIEATVTADPGVAVPDPAAGIIPAQLVPLSVEVSDEFDSTGVAVTQTRATGTVRFRSENTVSEVPIPQGTTVSTEEGVEFETTEAATAPRADFATSTPGTVDVEIRAVRTGPRGNVAADTITRLPNALANVLISVHNRQPTTGGERIEEAVATQEDYDDAFESLRGQLFAALQQRLSDPATTPRGLTLFRTTALMGEPVAEPDAASVVGTVAPHFSLTASAGASVLAVNETLLDELAAARLRSSVPLGQEVVGNITSTHSTGTVVGQTVVYQVNASAQGYSPPDQAALAEAVRGKTIDEARAILEPYGAVEITVWPDFIDRLPDQLARVSLSIVPPQENP